MQNDPAGLPQSEAQVYAMLRRVVDPGEALRLTTAIFPRPAPEADPQRQRWREHWRQPSVRAYTGI